MNPEKKQKNKPHSQKMLSSTCFQLWQ